MTPLLTLYADLLGMLGGALVGIGMLDIAPVAYVNRSVEALGIADFVMGLVKASVFGALIAFAGCSAACGPAAARRRSARPRPRPS